MIAGPFASSAGCATVCATVGPSKKRAQDQLERSLTQRAALARELGDPAAIHEERDGLASAIDTLARQHTGLRPRPRTIKTKPHG
jgi:hypothetical protein